MGFTKIEREMKADIKIGLIKLNTEVLEQTEMFKLLNERLEARAERLEAKERDASDIKANVESFKSIIKDLDATAEKLNEIIKEI